jgi:hypothetical protein
MMQQRAVVSGQPRPFRQPSALPPGAFPKGSWLGTHPVNQANWCGVLLLALLAGCGTSQGDHNAIHGEVKCDGQSLLEGSIMFVPVDGMTGNVSSGQIKDGRYAFTGKDGPAAGWQCVQIRASKKTGRQIPKPLSANNEMIDEQVEAVAPRFNSASTLKFEVKPGENTADFEVASK